MQASSASPMPSPSAVWPLPGLEGGRPGEPAAGGPSGPQARPRRRAKARFRLGRGALDALRLSAFSLVIVTLTAVHMYLGPLQHARPSFTLLILVAALMVLKPATVRWANLREGWPPKVVGGLLFMAVGSAVFGLSFGGSTRFIIEIWWKVLVFFVVLTVGLRHVKDLAVLIWSYVWSNAILFILSVTVLELEPTREGLGRLEGHGMLDANDIGMVMLMGIPLALLMVFNSGRVGRAIAWLALVGSPVTIALTGSRGAMVGLAIMAPAMFFALGRIKLAVRVGGGALLFLALALAAPSGYWKQMSTILDPSKDYNITTEYGRIGIAKRGVGYMLRYPFFGVGVANFPRAEGTISPIAKRREMEGLSVEWIAPHNTYVQVGAEMGIPALLLWFFMLYSGTLGLLKLRKRTPAEWEYQSADRRFLRDACLFIPMSYLVFAVTSYFLTHAYTTPIYILMAITTGVVVQVRRELKIDRAARRAQRDAAMMPTAGPGAPLTAPVQQLPPGFVFPSAPAQ